MSEDRPWWLSDPSAPPAWGGLLSQAQKALTWITAYATEQVLAPHSGHDDPSEHPDCALCQATGLIATAPSTPREEIDWVDARWTT